MPPSDPAQRELRILEQIETDPHVTQASLAQELGLAVGTVNFAVRRLVKKGYVRVKQLERRRLKYIIPPQGIALRTRLAMDSLKYSMRLYRETRAQAKRLLADVRRKGCRSVSIRGTGEIAEIVRLTALEMELEVRPDSGEWPTVAVVGTALTFEGSA